MGATTPPPPEVRRFSSGELWLHWCFAALMGVLILTAAALYVDPISALIGRRRLLASVHLWAGLILPVPVIAAMILSRALRDDIRALNRFIPADTQWLRRATRLDLKAPSGKFNAGQKLLAATVLACAVIMFVTGLMMHFVAWSPVDLRTGATFVHDVFAILLVVLVGGHLVLASNDAQSRHGMYTGRVSREWARNEHALWQPDDDDDHRSAVR